MTKLSANWPEYSFTSHRLHFSAKLDVRCRLLGQALVCTTLTDRCRPGVRLQPVCLAPCWYDATWRSLMRWPTVGDLVTPSSSQTPQQIITVRIALIYSNQQIYYFHPFPHWTLLFHPHSNHRLWPSSLYFGVAIATNKKPLSFAFLKFCLSYSYLILYSIQIANNYVQ